MSEFRVRVAESDDWPKLATFFDRAYRERHPLRKREFWEWRFGDREHGRSIVVDDGEYIVGHSGAAIAGGYVWMINVWLGEEARGQGLLRRMYDAAREFGPLAAASVNRAGLDMYRNMGWTRYADLHRYVAVNPAAGDLLAPVSIDPEWGRAEGDHYWDQPGIVGYHLPDGSTAVDQLLQGGLRVIDLVNPVACAKAAFAAGVTWLDFVTSWADPLCRTIDREAWVHEDDSSLPWRMDPVIKNSKAHISVLAEKSLPSDFIVSRRFSDHGRIASL